MYAIWFQTTDEKKATVTRVNDQYAYAIFTRQFDRYGKKVAGNLITKGVALTLEEAKHIILADLGA